VELTVNYRTPSEIMDVAARVLRQAAPGLLPPESVRSTGVFPKVVAVDGYLGDAVAQLAREEAAIVAGETAAGGTVAVICPASLLEALSASMVERQLRFGGVAGGALDDTVSLLPVEAAKGLEFDSVIVVEPARIAEEATQGLQALYVALTRATRRLALVHQEPLPEALADISRLHEEREATQAFG
jgi:DNA helicase IV